jgi:hypothetical protein
MYIKQLKIENLRSLESVTLALNEPGTPQLSLPNVNVMLGGNGLGKTSVLRAAALAALGPLMSSSSGFVPEALIRRPSGAKPIKTSALDKLPPARITADVALAPGELPSYARVLAKEKQLQMVTTVTRIGTTERLQWSSTPSSAQGTVERLQFDDNASAFFVVGYGATRRVEASTRVDESARIKSRLRPYERVSSLFEDHLGLIPLSYWLPAYAGSNKGRYAQVVALMNELLPDACRMQKTAARTENGTEHLFTMNGVSLPFRALSDGYRAYIGWIGDMLFHVCMGAGSGVKLRDIRGVLLLDEIDLHLHPEWQRVVVPTLARALPKMQFIVTTHSPLVVGSLEAGNLFVLADEAGRTVVKRLPERVHGRSAEQILLSPYFGLESTRAPEVSKALSALAADAVGGDATASMKYLELLSKGLPKAEVQALANRPAKRSTTRRKAPAASK